MLPLLGLMLEFEWDVEQDICDGQHVESITDVGTISVVTDCVEQVNTDWKHTTGRGVVSKLKLSCYYMLCVWSNLQHKSDNCNECTKLTFPTEERRYEDAQSGSKVLTFHIWISEVSCYVREADRLQRTTVTVCDAARCIVILPVFHLPGSPALWYSWKVVMQCRIVASSDLQSHSGFPGSVSPRAGGEGAQMLCSLL